jgi:hypothetical protein
MSRVPELLLNSGTVWSGVGCESLGPSESRAAVAEMRQPDWKQGQGLDTSPDDIQLTQPETRRYSARN